MSNFEDVHEDSPVENDGQVAEVDGADDNDARVLDIDEFADHYVTVKVDGEEVRVPLSEAVAGYSRQADYTPQDAGTSRATSTVAMGLCYSGGTGKQPSTNH